MRWPCRLAKDPSRRSHHPDRQRGNSLKRQCPQDQRLATPQDSRKVDVQEWRLAGWLHKPTSWRFLPCRRKPKPHRVRLRYEPELEPGTTPMGPSEPETYCFPSNPGATTSSGLATNSTTPCAVDRYPDRKRLQSGSPWFRRLRWHSKGL